MKTLLYWLGGVATGCLLMLLLKIPLFKPFDTNTATVVAALSSTVLAVAGAFALWWHQTSARQDDLEKLLLPIFEPLYIALAQLRDILDDDKAKTLIGTIHKAVSSETLEPTALNVAKFRDENFKRVTEAALVEANTVLEHWTSLQDVLSSISPTSVPKLLALHRVAVGARSRLPQLYADSKPRYLEQVGPQVKPQDFMLLNWAVGCIAIELNQIDGGKRDESGYHAIQPARAAAIGLWGGTHIA